MTTNPIPDTTKEYWMHLSQIQGHIAMWAVRQSPYHCPDYLLEVLSEFRTRSSVVFDKNDMSKQNRAGVRDIITRYLFTIPEVQAWNERKNGNKSPSAFVDRYSRPTPDDDFIDLDALRNNVVRGLFKELEDDEIFTASLTTPSAPECDLSEPIERLP
jgi:hypothetical protein